MIHYLQFQIYWPSPAGKVEECIMKGKDTVSTLHCRLNKARILKDTGSTIHCRLNTARILFLVAYKAMNH